jgi:hypothetical protein
MTSRCADRGSALAVATGNSSAGQLARALEGHTYYKYCGMVLLFELFILANRQQ